MYFEKGGFSIFHRLYNYIVRIMQSGRELHSQLTAGKHIVRLNFPIFILTLVARIVSEGGWRVRKSVWDPIASIITSVLDAKIYNFVQIIVYNVQYPLQQMVIR